MKVLHVIGARPNFMKAAPAIAALAKVPVNQILVHTGQHYDANMSDVFFQQLRIPAPDYNLEVGSGSHAAQTAQVMTRIEPVIEKERPDLVLVYGDVNSTVAAALVCAKLLVKLGHVEAGLRSFDRRMPEEVNRIVTDRLADMLFTPSVDGDENLKNEGVDAGKVFCIGNLMIDTLVQLIGQTQESSRERPYLLVTLHRPSNVDDSEKLTSILAALETIGQKIDVVFPIHPRTRQRLEHQGFAFDRSNISFEKPLGYLEFLSLQRHAKGVVTDSGGIQEETTFMGVPCLTLRENTERPITVTLGTNCLVGNDLDLLQAKVDVLLAGQWKKGNIPPLWDGKAGERLASIICGRTGSAG